jgi:hypothetical protein
MDLHHSNYIYKSIFRRTQHRMDMEFDIPIPSAWRSTYTRVSLSSIVDYILFPINYSGIIWLSWWYGYMSARVFLSMYFIRRECEANKRSHFNTLSLLFICISHDLLFMLSLAQESTIALTSILRSSSRMWWLSYNTVLWTMCLMSRSKRIKSTRFAHF